MAIIDLATLLDNLQPVLDSEEYVFCAVNGELKNYLGLTAAVASALAKEGISANVIAAYHHDHVFVPADKVDESAQQELLCAPPGHAFYQVI